MSNTEFTQDTRIVVTGATGFVGSHALMALWNTPHLRSRVVAACRDAKRLPTGYDGEVCLGDLRDEAYRQTLARSADTIVHAAAWTSLYGHDDTSNALFLDPSLALLDAAGKAGVQRFIMVSTTAAAPPHAAADPDAPGQAPGFWPHVGNVVRIENAMREQAARGGTLISLRLGLFIGERYGIGLLPILVPRLKSRLVPWVAAGRTPMPLIAGEDIGAAVAKAVTAEGLEGYQGFNILGPSIPTVRDVITFLAEEYGLPKPWFSVPFPAAHLFAAAMEAVSHVTPWDPFITRSIVYLLRDFHVDNAKAACVLGYAPRVDWRDAVRRQMREMDVRQTRPMAMIKTKEA